MKHLHGLQLANPVTKDSKFDISLLIGADYYWQFVGDHIVRGEGPFAMQSKLNYLLSGPLSPTILDTSVLHVSKPIGRTLIHPFGRLNLQAQFWS